MFHSLYISKYQALYTLFLFFLSSVFKFSTKNSYLKLLENFLQTISTRKSRNSYKHTCIVFHLKMPSFKNYTVYNFGRLFREFLCDQFPEKENRKTFANVCERLRTFANLPHALKKTSDRLSVP